MLQHQLPFVNRRNNSRGKHCMGTQPSGSKMFSVFYGNVEQYGLYMEEDLFITCEQGILITDNVDKRRFFLMRASDIKR